MLRSTWCIYSDVYIIIKGTITVPNTGTAAAPNNRNKKVILKDCALFTDCISEINNTETDHAKDTDVVMPMYNLIRYSDNYLKTFGNLWQYYKPVINKDDIHDFFDDPDSASFKSKQKITGQVEYDGTMKIFIWFLENSWNTIN